MKNLITFNKYTNKFHIAEVVDSIFSPITSNKYFFLNVLLLLVIPSMINAYWINHEQFVTISPIYKYGIKIRDGASFPYILFVPYVLSYVLSLLTRLLAFGNRAICGYIKLLIYIVLFGFFVINVFLLFNFGTMISPSVFMLIAETNTGETLDFFRAYLVCPYSIIAYIICFMMASFVIFSEKRIDKNIHGKYSYVIICLLSIYMFQRSISPFKTFMRLFDCKNLTEVELWYLDYPVNTNVFSNGLYSAYVMFLSKKEMGEALKNTLAANNVISTSRDLNVVMILGESFSKHHSSLYGYYLPTNPKLSEKEKSGNLFVFNDVISSYNLTSFVIRNLFSVNSIMDRENWSEFPAFPILFKNAGYRVYFWDNQRTFGKADVSDFSIASYLFNDSVSKASYTAYNDQVFQYDGDLINDFWNRVKLSGDKNLLIFHLMGQHTMPDKRYPQTKEFERIMIDDIKRDDLDDRRKKLVAQYDNATIYNDKVVCDIIDKFSDMDAVILYFSDHGEEIYDFRDRYGRTQEKEKTSEMLRAQYEIPFMIWCSDLFIKRHQEMAQTIKSAIKKPFMNDNVCQILMGLVGMKTHYYHPERDLISPQYRPYGHRNVQNSVNYERVRYGR